MAMIGLLPLLLWAGCRIPLSGWDAPARVLWWFVLLGGAGSVWQGIARPDGVGRICWTPDAVQLARLATCATVRGVSALAPSCRL